MEHYAKGHERDENRKMNKALFRSLWGILLSWVPLVGLGFAMSGFFRMCVRFTAKYRGKRIFLTVFSIVALLACMAVQLSVVYVYVQNPNILQEVSIKAWQLITRQETAPWQTAPTPDDSFFDYNYNPDPYADQTPSPDGAVTSDPSFDADFNDAELATFPEDGTVDYEQKALFDQIMENKRTGNQNSILDPVG